jgi:hypothetical protein
MLRVKYFGGHRWSQLFCSTCIHNKIKGIVPRYKGYFYQFNLVATFKSTVAVERDHWAMSKKCSEAGAGRFSASSGRFEDYLGDR